MDFVPLVAAAAVVITALGLVKAVKNKDWNVAVSTVAAWIIGVVVVLLLAGSDFGDRIALGDTGETLGSLDLAGLLLVGLVFSSFAQTLYDVIKAVDNTTTTKRDPLVKTE